MKFYLMALLFIGLFASLPSTQADGQSYDQTSFVEEDPPNFQMEVEAQDLFLEQNQIEPIAQTLLPEDVEPEYKDKPEQEVEHPLAQDYQLPPSPPPLHNQIEEANIGLRANPLDYGILGTVVSGMMFIIWYMVKSDRVDRKSLIEAVSALKVSVDAQRQSNDKMAMEMHSFADAMRRRLEGVEDKVTQLSNFVMDKRE